MNKHDSLAEFCRVNNLNHVHVGALVNLKIRPIDKYGNWKKIALSVSDALGEFPDDLFPEHLKIRLERNRAAVQVRANELLEIMEAADPVRVLQDQEMSEVTRALLCRLNPRESAVLKMRYGIEDGKDMTFEECGEKLDVTPVRARQIWHVAIKRLRKMEQKHLQFLHDHLQDDA